MPLLAVFFGITITVFFRDHNPPHVHASHGSRRGRLGAAEWTAQVTIRDGEVIGGHIPTRDLKLVRVWLRAHQEELNEAWQVARRGETPARIEPLRVR